MTVIMSADNQISVFLLYKTGGREILTKNYVSDKKKSIWFHSSHSQTTDTRRLNFKFFAARVGYKGRDINIEYSKQFK